ncbi:Ufm1-specific protease [Trichinella pseudospiralis]
MRTHRTIETLYQQYRVRTNKWKSAHRLAASWCEQLSKEGYTEYRQWKSDITDDETFLVKDCVASDQRPQVYNGSTSVSL